MLQFASFVFVDFKYDQENLLVSTELGYIDYLVK